MDAREYNNANNNSSGAASYGKLWQATRLLKSRLVADFDVGMHEPETTGRRCPSGTFLITSSCSEGAHRIRPPRGRAVWGLIWSVLRDVERKLTSIDAAAKRPWRSQGTGLTSDPSGPIMQAKCTLMHGQGFRSGASAAQADSPAKCSTLSHRTLTVEDNQ